MSDIVIDFSYTPAKITVPGYPTKLSIFLGYLPPVRGRVKDFPELAKLDNFGQSHGA
jgi:hypothetical protein